MGGDNKASESFEDSDAWVVLQNQSYGVGVGTGEVVKVRKK